MYCLAEEKEEGKKQRGKKDSRKICTAERKESIVGPHAKN